MERLGDMVLQRKREKEEDERARQAVEMEGWRMNEWRMN